MKELTTCHLCGGKDFKFLFKNHDWMCGVLGEFCLWQCSCGLVFIHPQPDETEIALFYPPQYPAYRGETPHPIREKMLKKLDRAYGAPGRWKFLARFFLFPFYTLTRGTIIKPGGRLLDFGCGAGDFLERMKGYGMEVYGVDFSEIAVSKARERGLSVFQGDLKEAQFPEEYFDVITLNHVFEHLHDPLEILRELRRILKKDGTIILGVPNIRSLGFKFFQRCWMLLETPRHLFLYSFQTLDQYAKKAHLRIVKKRYQCIPDFLLTSFNYGLNRFRRKKVLGSESRWIHSTFFNFHLFPYLFLKLCLFPFTTLLSLTPWADALEIWLKKE